jgi:hypothetical protein
MFCQRIRNFMEIASSSLKDIDEALQEDYPKMLEVKAFLPLLSELRFQGEKILNHYTLSFLNRATLHKIINEIKERESFLKALPSPSLEKIVNL